MTPRRICTEVPTKTYQTPQRHSNGSNITLAVMRKLGTVASVPGRCLITGAPTPYEVCHIISRATPIIEVACLERSWDPKNCDDEQASNSPLGIGPNDSFLLNLNTTRNLVYLSPTMHKLFDQA
ncbi:unnamed protein product [Rhizoctonia solani]|uniref:HNH nuclease domain-containing protein n=1 Tax=Rhizoctonia solani TaxID=456999 RepID=A0A8H3AKU2_9AGAM|nr:unnamed protein product [Rhizoctonia solani]